MKSSNAAGSWLNGSARHLSFSRAGRRSVASRRQTSRRSSVPGLSVELMPSRLTPRRMKGSTVVLRLGLAARPIDAITPFTFIVLAIQARASPPRLSTAPAQVAFSRGRVFEKSMLERSLTSLAPSFFSQSLSLSFPVIVDGATGGVSSIDIAALARLGYHVVALTGKESESDWLKKLGAKEVKLRSSIDFSKTRPLEKATWAGAVDNLGGEALAWMASTMKVNGVIASIGLAASPSLNTTVLPFILRGVSLLGINSTDSPGPELRREVWRRLATDLRPPLLKEMCRTIPFSQLPAAFDDFIQGKVNRRIVVDLAE